MYMCVLACVRYLCVRATYVRVHACVCACACVCVPRLPSYFELDLRSLTFALIRALYVDVVSFGRLGRVIRWWTSFEAEVTKKEGRVVGLKTCAS